LPKDDNPSDELTMTQLAVKEIVLVDEKYPVMHWSELEIAPVGGFTK